MVGPPLGIDVPSGVFVSAFLDVRRKVVVLNFGSTKSAGCS